MAIPIKCPGCQAAFEVPESIAGRTIRCTSCKTQLTVPAAAAAATRPAEKQFSFGAAAAAAKSAPAKAAPVKPAPAKPGSAGSALTLDDDDDDRPAKAKPAAARPAARRDDDDDEPKSRSSKPAKSAADMLPSGSKGKPARRRDDDDDDDEDDRPARRKSRRNQGAGAGPMLLLIGSGVLGLCAIIGVGVWLAISSGDSGETANNDTGDTPAETTPAGGPGETPGEGGDPQVNPRTSGGGWQTVQGSGFSASFPGTPKAQIIPGAGGSSAHVLEEPGRRGFFAAAVDLPPDAVRVMRTNPALKTRMFDEASRGFQRGSSGGFRSLRVRITGEHQITQDGLDGREYNFSTTPGDGSGVLRLVIGSSRLYLFGAYEPSGSSDVQQFMASFKITEPNNQVAMAPPGGMGMETGMEPGMPGMDPGMSEMPMPAVPPMPGMMPPMPGFPMPGEFPPMPEFPMPGGEAFPGGEQGLPGGMQAPPPGALTSPPLASKLTPFFAIAFDSKNKEVYAVTHRWTGRKTEGLLYRYTYPDFKPNGSYNLPNLATKAVIDTEKGMLYLASANLTNPNTTRTVAQMHYDRAFASGDIQVFDLAPIRNGKVEIRSELKPAAVVPMGGSIRGLELSADGKSAYVVVNRTSGRVTKSFLRQIDTATRKQIREKAMPEQMAAMRLSPDGKEIVALEYPTAPNKPVSVFVYDADSWALRAIPLPGASTDVAITTDGILLAGVIGTGAPSAAKLQMLGTQGTLPAEIPTVGWKASNNGYVAFSPDAKRLYVSSLGGFGPNGPANPGLDVYEIEDVEDVKTYKKIASVRDSGGVSIGGYFNLSPDGEYILFRTGAVLETAKLAENSGLAPGAVPPMPGTFPPGAGLPGMPPAPATPPAFPPGNEGEPAMPGAVVP